jgi:UDP-glucose 4-epimerase
MSLVKFSMRSKNILVTGGAGFIGSHLCERLYRDGNSVTSLDNYFTGSKENHVDGVDYIKAPTSDIHYVPIKETPDIVYHLGEYSRVEQSFDDIRLVHEYNTKGTIEVLEYAREVGAKIVYAGSSTKFSDNGADASPYAFSKAKNTELVMNYGKWYDMPYAITYFYNVYGDREISDGKYATLIGLFQQAMFRGENLKVVSPGTQRRNFTHIEDIINALILIGESGQGDGYGIGSDQSYSVLEVADMLGGEIEMLPERNGNRMSGEVITEKTRGLGWTPKVKLEDYI